MARLKRAAVTPVLPDLSAPGLAIGLGGVGVTLRDLVALYAAIARGGTAVALRDGVDDLPPSDSRARRCCRRRAAWYVADILAGVPPPINGSPGRIAYKTGTSYGYRDAWAIGFDGAHVVGVWVGRPDGTPVPGPLGHRQRRADPVRGLRPHRAEADAAAASAPPGTSSRRPPTLPTPLRRFRDPGETIVERRRTIRRSPTRSTASRSISASRKATRRRSSSRSATARRPSPSSSTACRSAHAPFARSETWKPDGPGFVTLSVVDATGRSDRVTVFLE